LALRLKQIKPNIDKMNFNKTQTGQIKTELSTNWLLYLLPLIIVGYYLFCWFSGVNQVINWQVMSQLEEKSAIIDSFKIGAQNYEIPAKVFYLLEQYLPTTLQVNQNGILIWLVFFSIGFCLIAAISTRFKSYWYLGVSTFIILIITSLGIDELFGQTNYLYSGLFLFSYISISYLFIWFFKNVNILVRFLVFAAQILLFVLLLYYFGTEPKPFLLLAIKTIPAALIISVLFIFAIAYDIILSVLTFTTKGGGSNNLLNFSIFSFIYLVNLSLTYLHNINYINWQMLYLSPFFILLLSSVLGFFYIEKKSFFADIFRSKTDLQYFYLSLALIALGLCSFAFATGNDPLTEALEDSIMYSHIVMGALFFVYVFFNFFPLFRQNYDVGKVVFKPLKYGLYYFRGAAVLVIFSILINNQFFPVMQSFAGYYNSLADHSIATEQYNMAELYFKTAIGFEHQNHKSNYGMASLAAKLGENPTAGKYYRLAVQKKPSEYAYAALSNSLVREDMFFEAMFAIKDGLKKYPKSGELQNNLALLFAKSKAMDSTLIYLQKAEKNAKNKAIPQTNLMWFYIKTNDHQKAEALASKAANNNYNALNANILADIIINSTNAVPKNNFQFSGDSTLNMANFAWLSNQTFYDGKHNKYIDAPFQKLIEQEGNFNINNDLQTAHILNEYYAGNKLKALDLLESININADTTKNGKYNQILFNTLLKKTTETASKIDLNSINTKTDAEKALLSEPLNSQVLQKSITILNSTKNEKIGYEQLIKALHFNPSSAELHKTYILQCFKINMTDYAKDGMKNLKSINIAEYNNFLPIYQAQLALVEKANEGFN
jgi:Tfp pilus assembly protein PilF